MVSSFWICYYYHKISWRSQNVTFCPFPVDFEYDIFKVDVIEDMSFMK